MPSMTGKTHASDAFVIPGMAIASLALAAQLIPAWAYGADAIGTLGSVIGKASIVRDGQTLPVRKGMEVFATDELVTGPKTAVKILFGDGGNVMAFEDSKMTISEYTFQRNGKEASLKSAFDVAKGKVRFFVKPEAGRTNTTTFKTSNAVMGIRGTSGFIDASSSDKTQLVVLTGKVEVSNPKVPGQSVLVPPNQMTDVVGTRAPTAPRAAPPTLVSSLKSQAARVDPKPDPQEQQAHGGDKGDKGDKRDAAPQEKDQKNDKGGESRPDTTEPTSGGGQGSGDAAPGSGSGAAPAAANGPVSADASAPAGKADADSSGVAADAKPTDVGGGRSASAPSGSAPGGASEPATSPATAPEPVPVDKKTVFTPEGKSSVVVNDARLSAMTASPTAISAGAGAAAATRNVQPPTDVIKRVNDVVRTSTSKAVEAKTAVQVMPAPRAVAAEAPKSKSVKVKVVLPPAP